MSNLWWGAFPVINHLEMCLQNGSVLCICNKVTLQSPVRGSEVFTLVESGGVASIDALVLLQVQEAGLSTGDAVTELMKMLVTAALFLRTSTNHDRQSVALLRALDIYLKVILYVANSSDHQFTLLLLFLPLRNFWKGLWSLYTMMSDLWR